MLLSSPAFSTFLNDLSGSGVPASTPGPSQSHNQKSTSRPESAPRRKDVNPHQAAANQTLNQQQNNMHVGLTMIPEENSFDYTATESMNTGYTNTLDFGGLYDAQVFAVTSVPQGPPPDSMEFSMLHGKSSNFVGTYREVGDGKDESAVIDRMPPVQKMDMPEPLEIPSEDNGNDVSDPAFALFQDQQSSSTSLLSPTVAPEDRIFGEMELDKAFGRVDLVLAEDPHDTAEVSAATLERFERLCSRLEASSTRLAALTEML